MGTVSRFSVFVLVLTLSSIGIPLPAHAAEDSPPLRFNGYPLSQLLNRAVTGDPFPLANLLGQETGEIRGTAMDGEGQPLAEHTVHATRVSAVGNRGERAAQRVGITTTNAEGQFSFTGLQASDYLLEVLVGDEVVASTPTTLVEGAMQVNAITLQSVPESGGLHPAAQIAIAAGIGVTLTFLVLFAVCYDQGC